MRALWSALSGLALCACSQAGERLRLDEPATYSGMADASAAVAVSSNLFAVANDEDNVLRVYRSDTPGRPVAQFDCNAFLDLQGDSLEADLEGAARIRDRIFWIGSHGRNKNGKERLNRDRFFATDLHITNGLVTLTPVGRPYQRPVAELMADRRLARFHFEAASSLTPKAEGALNIEGLSATPEGRLLLGFRNPVPDDKALLVPVLNPNSVIRGGRARLGEPIQLDLGGLGIRDIALFGGNYLIIAGSFHSGVKFRLYRWAGPGSEPQRLKTDSMSGYSPEAIVFYPQKGWAAVQILSDDGKRMAGEIPAEQRTFRSFWISPAE
jgi:hypothetical protein